MVCTLQRAVRFGCVGVVVGYDYFDGNFFDRRVRNVKHCRRHLAEYRRQSAVKTAFGCKVEQNFGIEKRFEVKPFDRAFVVFGRDGIGKTRVNVIARVVVYDCDFCVVYVDIANTFSGESVVVVNALRQVVRRVVNVRDVFDVFVVNCDIHCRRPP